MGLKICFGEVGISFQNINYYRAPGDDIAVLGFLFENDETAEDINTKTTRNNVSNGSLQMNNRQRIHTE